MTTALQARMKPYQGAETPRCGICFGEDDDDYVQTTCCTNSLGTEIIPNTYHSTCLQKWANSPQFKDRISFPCVFCKKVLLKQYFFPEMQISFGERFIEVIRDGIVDEVKTFLDDPQILDLPIGGKNSLAHALVIAARLGHNQVVKEILEHERVADIPLYADASQLTRLGLKRARLLLKSKYRKPIQDDFYFERAFYAAITEDHGDIVTLLLDCKAAREMNISRTLHSASIEHSNRVIRAMLAHERVREIPVIGDYGFAGILCLAAVKGNTPVVTEILANERAREIPINGSTEPSLGQALALASREGHTEAVIAILEEENVMKINLQGYSSFGRALLNASGKGSVEIVTALLGHERARELPISCLLSCIGNAKNIAVRSELVCFLKTKFAKSVKTHLILTTAIAAGIFSVIGSLAYYHSRSYER